LTLCDTKGTDYEVEIKELGSDYVSTLIISSQPSKTESLVDITLFQGIPKSDKMELIIQKSIELGIKRVVPVITERTVVKIRNESDAENKRVRWQRIALEAAKQSNRGIIPHVDIPITFDHAIAVAKDAQLGIIAYEKEKEQSLKKFLTDRIQSVSVLIGPEGGFTEDEVSRAYGLGIKPITLGPRILRTETAGIAVVSILMYELGDI